MADEDRKRWDEKHAGSHEGSEPSAFLKYILEQDAWPLIPGLALDVAAGKGRNAAFLSAKGFDVEGIDVSEVALDAARRRAPRATFAQGDLDEMELGGNRYDLIVNFNFLSRALIPKIKRALKPGGHIVFETYLIDQRTLGHPRNPDYLLLHNELLDLFRGFRVLFYREGKFAENSDAAYRASLFARK
jgi:SAM-dependent methyltransferase